MSGMCTVNNSFIPSFIWDCCVLAVRVLGQTLSPSQTGTGGHCSHVLWVLVLHGEQLGFPLPWEHSDHCFTDFCYQGCWAEIRSRPTWSPIHWSCFFGSKADQIHSLLLTFVSFGVFFLGQDAFSHYVVQTLSIFQARLFLFYISNIFLCYISFFSHLQAFQLCACILPLSLCFLWNEFLSSACFLDSVPCNVSPD